MKELDKLEETTIPANAHMLWDMRLLRGEPVERNLALLEIEYDQAVANGAWTPAEPTEA